MNIPDYLISQIKDGKVVVFLGAGASRAAVTPDGKGGPTAKELGRMIAEKFLGGKYVGSPLNQIAEYAISESDLASVQNFIKDILAPLQPTPAHFQLTEFYWHGLATTNYERLTEEAYERSAHALQTVRALVENGDRVEDNARNVEDVILLKLHGCITRTASPDCTLILTTDQYIEHRHGRDRLFDVLRSWGYEHPIVFIGSSLQDSDIRTMLSDLTKSTGENRPRYYLVAPDVDDVVAHFWDSKKVTTLKGTFEEFTSAMNAAIPVGFRSLAGRIRTSIHPIEQKFRLKTTEPSKALWQFLETDVDYVNALNATDFVNPKDFYKGFSPGFAAVEQGLDVRRQIADTILTDYFLRDLEEQGPSTETILVKAHAGAGKSVLLRRIAWDAAHLYDDICLFLRSHGVISAAAIQELITLCRQRIFLFVDDAADRTRELQSLLKNIGPEGKYLTVVLGERINEWNMQGQAIAPYITDEFELKYLTSGEVDALLTVLEKNRALGTLEPLNLDQRRAQLSERAGRQLLVALHEATSGVSFEDILVDEFNKIEPYAAQRIYLTICVLNRLNIPVRAGLIARVHGVPFSMFQERFFSPLEHVVFAEKDPIIRDYTYQARHPHIADVVFTHILSKPEDRFDVYVRCLKALSLGYTSDWKAFWEMIRAKHLIDLFPDQTMIRQIFEAGREVVGEDPHLLHQKAIFEMNRTGADLQEGGKLLNRAMNLAPYDASIKHSMAELKLREVDTNKTELEKSKLLREAMNISLSLVSDENTSSYAHHTVVKVGLRKLQEAIEANASEIEVEKLLKDVEQRLFDSLQRFPGDAYLLETDSRLAKLLGDSQRLISSLERAFKGNNRNGFIALRLAAIYEKQDHLPQAAEVLEKALAANSIDKRLHYALAKTLMKAGASEESLIYHLQRSFSEGDSNYDAQVLYGRQLYLRNDSEKSRAVFKKLSQAKIGFQYRRKFLYPIENQRFQGKISKREASYCFITRDGSGDWVYVHTSNMEESVWKSLLIGSRVEFSIGFNLRGAIAFDIEIVSSSPLIQQKQIKLFKEPI